jgi:hypothetical protein
MLRNPNTFRKYQDAELTLKQNNTFIHHDIGQEQTMSMDADMAQLLPATHYPLAHSQLSETGGYLGSL